ncbi:MAG: hypothetical protein GY780_10940 [bacterium]|nr:hypothetical protein [bacterium]
MAGDGVSLPTQLSQMGSVAKNQARAQQAALPTTKFDDKVEKEDALKAQRVKEAEKASKKKIDADEDRRQKRRKRRQNKMIQKGKFEMEDELVESEQEKEEDEEVGLLVDLRA